jgi:hypothetical protein
MRDYPRRLLRRDYPWYDVVTSSDDLQQGDFIENCLFFPPPEDIPLFEIVDESDIEVKPKRFNVIVLSQSCDIKFKKIRFIVVCPYWSLSSFQKENPYYGGEDGFEELRRGNTVGYRLLSKCDIPQFKREAVVASFREVYSLPFRWLITSMTTYGVRLRLLPPYREHLSQEFARFFMRVGLPDDIVFD